MLRFFTLAIMCVACGFAQADIVYSWTPREGGGGILTAAGNGELDGLSTVISGSFPTNSGTFFQFKGNGVDQFEIALSDVTAGSTFYSTPFNLISDGGAFIPFGSGATFGSSRGTLVDKSLNSIQGINQTWKGFDTEFFRVYSDDGPVTAVTLNTGFAIETAGSDFSGVAPGTIIYENPNGTVGRNRIIFQVGVTAVPEPSIAVLLMLGGAGLVCRRRRP